MTLALVFPGQGSQALGMMKPWATQPEVLRTFAEAQEVLGQNLWALCAEDGDLAAVNATVNTQPLMLTAGVAVYRAYQAAGGRAPAMAAGHSLGEYTALVAAEALSFADALALVRLRAEAMQAAVPEGQGAMAAVLGLDDEAIRAACAEAAQGEVVAAVNLNAPGQVVIAGHAAAVQRAIECCKARGAKRALPLPVSVPSHCALMQPAAAQLEQALQRVTLRAPVFPVLHNADVATASSPEAIAAALVKQLYSPVRWVETMQAMQIMGVTALAELGPGKVLAGLAKRGMEGVALHALVDEPSLNALLAQ